MVKLPSPKQMLWSTTVVAVLHYLNGSASVSKSCEMDDVRKDRCGGRRISDDACLMLGCCWSPPVGETIDGRLIPWCYFSSVEEPLSIIDNSSSSIHPNQTIAVSSSTYRSLRPRTLSSASSFLPP